MESDGKFRGHYMDYLSDQRNYENEIEFYNKVANTVKERKKLLQSLKMNQGRAKAKEEEMRLEEMKRKMKRDMNDLKVAENSKFMNLMMMAMMMTNYNSMVSNTYTGLSIKRTTFDEKNTPSSILKDLGLIHDPDANSASYPQVQMNMPQQIANIPQQPQGRSYNSSSRTGSSYTRSSRGSYGQLPPRKPSGNSNASTADRRLELPPIQGSRRSQEMPMEDKQSSHKKSSHRQSSHKKSTHRKSSHRKSTKKSSKRMSKKSRSKTKKSSNGSPSPPESEIDPQKEQERIRQNEMLQQQNQGLVKKKKAVRILKLKAAAFFIGKFKKPYEIRRKSIENFNLHYSKLYTQLIESCKKACKRPTLLAWGKDLDTNVVRDNVFLEHYDTKYEDDIAEKAIPIIVNKVNAILDGLIDGVENGVMPDSCFSYMRELFARGASVPKNFFFKCELEMLKFTRLGGLAKDLSDDQLRMVLTVFVLVKIYLMNVFNHPPWEKFGTKLPKSGKSRLNIKILSSVMVIALGKWFDKNIGDSQFDYNEVMNAPKPKEFEVIDPDFGLAKSRSPYFFIDELGADDLAIFFEKSDSSSMIDRINNLSKKLYDRVFGVTQG